jgi:hypothetical protein
MISEGKRPPPPFFEQPSIPPHLEFYWQAFADLSSERPVGFSGAGAIPLSSLWAYAERFGIVERDEFDRFKTIIWAMDGEYNPQEKNSDTGIPNHRTVPMTDISGIKALLQRHAKPNGNQPNNN